MEYLSAKTQTWLPWFLRGILILVFILLIGRLVEIQIIKGNYFRNLSEGNRIRKVTILAPRGNILARGGEKLVGNISSQQRIIFDAETGYQKVDHPSGGKEDEIVPKFTRDYLLGEKFAHVSGYLGQVTAEEVGKINPDCPELGPKNSESWVGRSGLEQVYDCLLSGHSGEELIEVDTTGKKIRTLGRYEPTSGSDLKTTIDYGLQVKISEVMQGKPGAVVVSDPQGEILALYSSPAFDPNIFLNPQNSEIQNLLTDNNHPLFNRVIGGLYHPGSVFKTIVALAGLEEGVIDENFVYDDPGVIIVNEFSYANWYFTQYHATEGKIGLVRAIQRSTDTFFYKLGEMIGIDKLVKWARLFKLDTPSGIDLIGEQAGLVPSPEWKKQVKNEKWFLGNTYHVSIGQGDLALTPLMVNSVVATLANNGKYCPPRIGQKTSCSDLGISQESLDIVIQGMTAACSQGGTGYTFFDSQPQVACKTGTAETGEKDVSHAWFTFFAPVDLEKSAENKTLPVKPELVVTVLVEKGGEGSRVAGPIAREIFDYWFGRND